jgi:hypothetical protein
VSWLERACPRNWTRYTVLVEQTVYNSYAGCHKYSPLCMLIRRIILEKRWFYTFVILVSLLPFCFPSLFPCPWSCCSSCNPFFCFCPFQIINSLCTSYHYGYNHVMLYSMNNYTAPVQAVIVHCHTRYCSFCNQSSYMAIYSLESIK